MRSRRRSAGVCGNAALRLDLPERPIQCTRHFIAAELAGGFLEPLGLLFWRRSFGSFHPFRSHGHHLSGHALNRPSHAKPMQTHVTANTSASSLSVCSGRCGRKITANTIPIICPKAKPSKVRPTFFMLSWSFNAAFPIGVGGAIMWTDRRGCSPA